MTDELGSHLERPIHFASEVASRHSHSGLAQPGSRRAVLPGEWRLHPQRVQLIWRRFGLAQVDLFASLETSHCQLFYSLTEGTLGLDALAHSWPQGLRKYALTPVSLLPQTLCKIREDDCLPPPLKSMWLRLLPTMTPWKGSRWGSMTGSSGSLGGRSSSQLKLYSCLHWPPSQEGWGPACIFGRLFVPRFWTGGFPDNPEAPAWLCEQDSHYLIIPLLIIIQIRYKTTVL